MNINGFVEELPDRLAQLLNGEGWTDLQTKQIIAKEFAQDYENCKKIILVSKDIPRFDFQVIMLNSELD